MSSAEAADANPMNSQAQESLLAAMRQPEFYPKPPAEVTHKETHISHLFFAGELVYKVKKPVRYSFLDYSSLEKRRYFLQEELRLNRRLAPSVYIGVLPITFDDLGWRLGGWAEPAEYTLVMRRLPEKRMLPFLLETGQVTPAMMRELAEFVFEFHDTADRVAIEPERYPEIVEKQWRENLADLAAYIDQLIDAENFRAVEKFGADFIEQHAELLQRRAAEGWIRDVHGDLHTEHICFAPEGIQIFDCIEFKPLFRRCDLAAEIAFLAMDVEVRGGGGLVAPFLTRYAELLDDGELMQLLPFWKCQRALVRGKVYALRGPDGFAGAVKYLRYATRLSWAPLQPFVVMICGLTGSGKSTLARQLSERTGAAVMNSDVIRKAIAGQSGRQFAAYGEGIYSATMTEKTYKKMARTAEQMIAQGKSAILDASFVRRAQRDKVVRLAGKHKIPLLVIHCSASERTTQERLAQRQAQGLDVSDGRWDVYLEQKKACEPLDEIPLAARLELNTDASLDQLTSDSEKFLRRRLICRPG
jgi:aminoglycoside phosphotransferase family enzyme/predicted kinase